MINQSCVFTINYAPNTQIRESLFKLEEKLDDFQKPFTLVPIPSDAPMEIPRIIATTLHGHSRMTISGNNIQLDTKFSGEFLTDIDKCIEYIERKCRNTLTAWSIINNSVERVPEFYFSGITMNLLFDENDGISDPVRYINDHFLKCDVNLSVDEAQFRTAIVLNDQYYVNIQLQNIREFACPPNERGSFGGVKHQDKLQVVLDINDRYAYNYRKEYVSKPETVSEIAKLMKQFCTCYIGEFVEKGKINYVPQ